MLATEAMTTMIKTYSELIRFKTLEERYRYLRIGGRVGEETFGFDRWMNQVFYKDPRWRDIRDEVITRDNGCDLGLEGYDIHGKIFVHHMNPVTKDDILYNFDSLLNPEFLISTSKRTHDAIHYGNEDLLPQSPIVRTRNDTCPWKHGKHD